VSAADVWFVDLTVSPAELDRCWAVLDRPERDRADRFLRPADRARYVASHAALRRILAEPLDCDPAEIRFATGAGGKPALAGSAQGALNFNLSHSGARALIGLAPAAAIGVDVELIRPISDAGQIARTHFAADEASSLLALPPDEIECVFYGLWTRKEAVVKALGTGLSLPLDRFSVTLPPAPPRLLRWPGAGGWTLAELDVGSDYAATVAVRSAHAEVRSYRLPADWPEDLG
jgi:4'-phosphopantetheinyl transferase